MNAQLDRENPWPGLESFEENARDYFHGREAEAEDLLRRVTDAPLTVLFGKSGLGKTSLLKAGLFPRLREKHFLPVHVRLDIRPDAPELGEQLRDSLLAVIARERVDAPPLHPGETLWEYLHRADLELWSEQNYPLTPVFVLDQFEEVFTLGERLPESVEGCKIDLGDLAENRIPAALAGRLAIDSSAAQALDLRRMAYKLVVTLREDFLPHLEAWRAAVPSLGRVRVRLLPMRPEQALSAVYDTAPHLMDEPLARRIVAFVAAAAQGDAGEIEPALLSLFCRGLNERRKRQGADRFDEQLLEGAQQSIIADYYRSCVEGLPDSVSRFIESDLITEKGFRNSYAKDDAVPAFLTEEQLDRLINRRLLRVEERYGTARIELTHDLLTRAVMADRDRRRMEEERQTLAAQARTQRRRILATAFVAFVCVVFAGIAAYAVWWAAVAARKASENAEVVAVAAQKSAKAAQAKAIRLKEDADRARDEALRLEVKARTAEAEARTQARLAEDSVKRELVARASAEARRLETEAQLVFNNSGKSADAAVKATLLSVASLRQTRTIDGQKSLMQFLGLLQRAPLWRRSAGEATSGQRHTALAVSPDGARIAFAGGSDRLQLLDARTGQSIRSFEVPRNNASMTVLAFSPDGASLVLGCGHEACVLDAASGKPVARLPGGAGGDMVWSASFSPDGKSLAIASYNSGEVLVYDVATWHKAATIRSGGGSVFSAAFSPQGEWLATGGGSDLQLWRVGDHETSAAQVRNFGPVWSIAFQLDGKGLVAAGQNLLRAWQIMPAADAGATLAAVGGPSSAAHTVLPISWHDRPCFAAAAPGVIHLLCGDKLDQNVLSIPVSSAAAAVSPDKRLLFNEQNDGTLAAWRPGAGLDAARIPVGGPVQSMASADQGGWLAVGTDNGGVAIVGIDPWKELRRLPLPPAPVEKLAVSSDGRWLAAVQGASLHVFDAVSWREAASRTYEQDIAGAFFVAGDRLVVATGTHVVVWQAEGWRQRLHLEHEQDATIEALKVSPTGRQLATKIRWSTGGHDGGAYLTRVFDLASGNETGWEYTTGGSSNISKKFMEEEAARKRRALAGGDTASVRAAMSSWPVLELKEPDEQMSADRAWSVAFSESVATLTDVASGREIAFLDHGGPIKTVRFVPSLAPRWLVTAGEDGTVAVWPIRTEDLIDEACARLQAIFDPKDLAKLIAGAHAEGSCK